MFRSASDEPIGRHLLGVEVFESDVAEAFLHLARIDKVNAVVLTVDGGAIAASFR